MAKTEYIFEVVEDFTESFAVEWVAYDGSAVDRPTPVEFKRHKGDRFIIRGVAKRKTYDADPHYRRVA